MIRESFRRKIIESLNESNNLKGVDFFIEETEEYSGVRVSIKYKYKEEYFFNISINSEREQLYHCEASPVFMIN